MLDTQGLLFSFPRHGNQSRIWEMKEDERTKSLGKNQLCAIFYMRDIWRNVLPKLKKLCMETPCWCPFKGYKYGRRKPESLSLSFCVNA